MKHSYVTTLGIALMLVPQAVQAQGVMPPSVPANLEVSAPNEVFLVGHAVGTQNYVCQPGSSLGRVNWVLFTPQATLFGEQDEQLTTHFFSPNTFESGTVRPTWQDSRDTSIVWGRGIQSSADPNFVAPGAIPWLLIEIVGADSGPTGGDTLTGTTFIQRVNTEGGAAPSTGCERLPDVGKRAFVPYTADYFFYSR